MNIVLKCVGGPLDGTYEFPNYSRGNAPLESETNRFLAWSLLTLTKGELGKAVSGISPAGFDLMRQRGGEAIKGTGATAHPYIISERREDGDTVFVTATHMPDVAPPPNQPMLLSEYTIEQLVNELIHRPQFSGLVAYALKEKQGAIRKGEQAKVAMNLSSADAGILLKSLLRLPQFGGQSPE